MKILWTDQGWDHYTWWQSHNPRMVKRINEVIKDIRRSPFAGIGKPEPLRNELSGWWSRRIDEEHRLVYRLTGSGVEEAIEIAACRFHYKA